MVRILSLLLLVLLARPLWAAEPRDVIVGVYDYPPLLSIKDGRASGFVIDILQSIAREKNWRIAYRSGTLYELRKALQSNEIDILPGVVRNTNGEEHHYVDVPLLQDWGELYVAPGKVPANSITELNHRRIGRLNTEKFGQLAQLQLGMAGMEIQWQDFPTYPALVAALLAGQVDSILISHLYGNYQASFYDLIPSPLLLTPQARTLELSDDASVLKPGLEQILLRYKSNQSSIYYRTMDRYLGTSFEERMQSASIVFIVVAVILLLVGLILLSRYLNHLVFKRTEQLADTNDRLSEMNRNLDVMVRSRTLALENSNSALMDSRLKLEDNLNQLQDMQQQLVEAEKMSALGGLVAGVAHEINTPLGIAVTSASLLDEQLAFLDKSYRAGEMARSDLEEFLETTRESVQILNGNLSRAADLVQSFKRMAVDQSVHELRQMVLGEYLNELLLTLKPNLRKHQVEVKLTGNLQLACTTFPGPMAQIITNLVMNVLLHAFTENQQQRQITLEISEVESPEAQREIMLVFSDNGRGVDVEALPRLFEPFYTTRRGDGGTGLGLHLVYNLVTQSLKGRIYAQSAPNEGLTLVMCFPDQGVS
ncbi:ATP-binding protein [Pokkaliibacter sp. CJK22405]|uniref:ATP-binding protein n=1 Tax=Pokkaliibacter sp. CJK22405 TaxID=3384615 RepID=UPI0039853E6E